MRISKKDIIPGVFNTNQLDVKVNQIEQFLNIQGSLLGPGFD